MSDLMRRPQPRAAKPFQVPVSSKQRKTPPTLHTKEKQRTFRFRAHWSVLAPITPLQFHRSSSSTPWKLQRQASTPNTFTNSDVRQRKLSQHSSATLMHSIKPFPTRLILHQQHQKLLHIFRSQMQSGIPCMHLSDSWPGRRLFIFHRRYLHATKQIGFR